MSGVSASISSGGKWARSAAPPLLDAPPAQAWNALTVGGYTEKYRIDAGAWPGWHPLAQPGDLAPSSCTSTTWGKWAIKPDIVMEAGNMAANPAHADPDYLDDLQLL
ncbi:MAG TPA: S8 family serine peptidase [Roseiarcus sp.]|nr:S8 family serine peptidase [Roseiarcus sp.]